MAVLPLGLLSFQSLAWLPFSLQCLARVGLAWGAERAKVNSLQVPLWEIPGLGSQFVLRHLKSSLFTSELQ